MDALEEARAEYFKDCRLVVRAPGCFFLSGDHSVEFGQPALLLAVNFWVYVGIDTLHDDDFNIQLTRVNPSAPIYNPKLLDPNKHYSDPDNIGEYLQKRLDTLRKGLNIWKKASPNVNGFSIKAWSDIPFAVGLNANAAFAACLGMLLYAQTRNLDNEALNRDLLTFMGQDHLTLKRNDVFKRVFQLGRWCDALMAPHVRSGAQVFASLMRTSLGQEIVLYFTEKRDPGSIKTIIDPTAADYVENMADSEAGAFYGTRLKAPDWFAKTYHISIVYCGQESDPNAVLADMSSWHRLETARLRTFLNQRFGDELRDGGQLSAPLEKFISPEPAEDESPYWPHAIYASGLGAISWRILDTLLSDANEAKRLSELFIDYSKMLKAYGVLRGPLRDFKREFRHKIIDKKFRDTIWTKLIGPGNGGDLLVFGEAHDIQEINQEIKALWGADGTFGPQLHCSSGTDGEIVPYNCLPVWDSPTGTDPIPPTTPPRVSPPRKDDGSGNKGSIPRPKRSPGVRAPRKGVTIHKNKGVTENKSPVTAISIIFSDGSVPQKLEIKNPKYVSFLDKLGEGRSEPLWQAMSNWEIYKEYCDQKRDGKDVIASPIDLDKESLDKANERANSWVDNFKGFLKERLVGISPTMVLQDVGLHSDDRRELHRIHRKGWRLRDDVKLFGFSQDITSKRRKTRSGKIRL
jgi:hypothetical protein